jgi:hypothetical protein
VSPVLAASDRFQELTRGLTTRQTRAIAGLVDGLSQAQAATLARVSPRTLRRWQAEATFARALQAARDEAVALTVRRLEFLAGLAVDALSRSLMAVQKGADPKAVANIAAIVLDRAKAWRGDHEVETRLKAVEVALARRTR